MASCDVDLTAPPFNVLPGDPSVDAAKANTAGINLAITTHAGKMARLVLPAGEIFVDQAETDRGLIDLPNWSIKFGAGVTDLALVGHGMFCTRIVVQGAGDGGAWHGIMVDGASRIELANFGIQMGIVLRPDPGDQNHLISILCSAGTTHDIVGHHLFFGQAVGDGLRIFGNASPVTNIRFTDFVMRMSGIGAGSRSGVALQRGWKAVELANFYIDGVKNSPIDMEPSGDQVQPMSHLNIQDGFIDQSQGASVVAFSIGGVSHGERARHVRVSDVTVLEGRVNVLSTDNLRIRNLTIVATARFTGPLFLVRQINNDLILEGLYLERAAGSRDGDVLDIENAGTSTTIDEASIIQGAAGYPMRFDRTKNLRIRGIRIRYDGASPDKHDGVCVLAGIGDADNVQIDDVGLTSSTGKLRSAVRLAARQRFTMTALRVKDIHSAGSAHNGVYLSYHPEARADLSPLITGIYNGTDLTWTQVDHNDNTIGTVYPMLAGSPGAGRILAGPEQPGPDSAHGISGAVGATGDIYQHLQGGPGHTLYIKETGDGTADGWAAK